ncbi:MULTISPECIES: DUF4114 domain-containing protein [unclassified Desertifilum]|nr:MULTISPECIES: DUF4114 domain-containing protein [unclassified Desertifilum]MBD2324002.1 DUF4114 domain-containing protein [Desertifilum sp. FACHB-866]MBD2333937.1 DUF4114 domain-containing protein [Desertifilum sp. FACHB-868]
MRFFSKKRQKPSVELSDQSFILEPILTPSGIVDGSDDNDPSALALTVSLEEIDDFNGEFDSAPDLDLPDAPEILDNFLDRPIPEAELELLDFAIADSEVEMLLDPEIQPELDLSTEIELPESVKETTIDSLNLERTTNENELSNADENVALETEDSNATLDPEEAIAETEPPQSEGSEGSFETEEIAIASEEMSNDGSELATSEETEISDNVELNPSLENESDPETTAVENSEGSLPENEIDSPDDSDPESIDPILPPDIIPQAEFTFDSGVFTIGESGVVGIDFLFDGGAYKGELGMFSLEGMNEFEPGSEAFIQEAARRALSQSELGHVVISDIQEGARFSAALPHEGNFNSGEYLGVKEFTMRAGDKVAFMLIPNGTVERIFEHPGSGGHIRPLFSLATANPNDMFHAGQIADVTGEGNTFVFEDLRVDGGSDRDYNDIIFQVRGAKGEATLMESVIDPAKDWRTSDMGQALLAYTQTYITPDPVDNGLPDLLAELDDLDALLNPPAEAEQPDTSDPVSPDLDADSLIDEPEGDNPDAPETNSIEDIETPPSDSLEPIVEENADADLVDETPEASPESIVEENADTVSETPEIPQEPAIEDNSEADSIGETPSEQEPVVAANSEDSPSASIGEESFIDNGENNSTLDPQENTANQGSDTPDTPLIDVPRTIPSAEFVTRIENITTSLRNPEVAAAVGSETEVMALTSRLERLTQTLSRQETVTPESAIAINNLLNRVEILSSPPTPSPVTLVSPPNFTFAPESQPLVGVINTGFSENSPSIDSLKATLGNNWVNSDRNPLLLLDTSPGKWTDALVEFVDAARESGQPNAVINLSLDLTQINPDGSLTTRYELTIQEKAALAYAQRHNVLVVVSAGEQVGQMSALGKASLEFDNVITVGAAARVNDAVALSKAYDLAENSGSGAALDILADGSTQQASVQVTAAISQVWATNPKLNYTQVIDILKRTATDLGKPNWDLQTGSGLLNMVAVVHLAKATQPEPYTIKPGQRTITDNFISQPSLNKQLPGDPTHPAATLPGIPETQVDTGGNSLTDATQLLPSATVDIIDQVSSIDPIDVFRTDSRYLQGADFSVLDGELSIQYLTPSGQLLGTQVLGKGSHQLELPAHASGEIVMKIERRNQNPATYMLYGFESTKPQPFNIDLEFDSPLTASQKQILKAAAKNVADLIGQGLPTAIVDGKIIDDINIKISTANLDGAGGTQARTKIDFMRYGSLLPAQSLVQFDAADIAELERSGSLFDVAQHEFLHALGFGNLWEAKGLVNYAGTPLAQYNGRNAVGEFQKAGGLMDTIALETEGNGSASLHWHQQLFPNEIMTADLNGFTGEPVPISAVTIASLADLGYVVNLDRATPGYQLFGSQTFNAEDLTPEQIEAFRQLAEMSFEEPDADYEYIAPIMPTVDPDTVAPEIWAHAERAPNGEYYDWVPYQIKSGDTLSHLALRYLGNASYDYYMWIANRNGIPNEHYIVAGNWIQVPIHHPNYAWKQEQERLRREEELRRRQEEEERQRREQEEAFRREQERVRQEEEARRREAEAKQRELEEQERRLREERERRRQEEERRLEEARLAELARQAEIARQQGKGGLDWYIAKPLPEFGPVDPFETRLTGETVGNLVPDDYYRFTLSRNGRITAELRQLLADADLVLYDVRNRPIAYSMREGVTDEHLIADLIPGTYMLRVNSPKGVTTDYELIVKFKHLLSQTEQGPPPGWQVGGGNGGSGGSGGGAAGPLFSDPRIQRIYDTALKNFADPERAKANDQIAALEREKRGYEQERQALLDKMNAEQRAKVHQALDNERHKANVWVDNITNPIKNTVDSLADGIINQANSVADSLLSTVNNIWDFGNSWIKDRKEDARNLIRQGRDAVKSAVNNARSWLKAELGKIQDAVKSAVWHFFEAIKNAYRTGGEINQIIADAANAFRSAIDRAVRGANELVGNFKGQVLNAVDWTKNLGISVSGFNFNAYNQVVKPAVDAIASGVSSTINGIGNSLKDITNWLEPRTQDAVAKIVNALLGDQTGNLWNKINGVDAKIAATRTGLEKAIAKESIRLKDLLNKADDLIVSVVQSPQYIDDVIIEVGDYIKEHWPVILATTTGFIAAEVAVGLLAAVPEPTLLTKVAAVTLQGLIIAMIGTGVVIELGNALSEADKWWNLATTANGDREQIAAASRSFIRMIGHAALAIAGAKQFKSKLVRAYQNYFATHKMSISRRKHILDGDQHGGGHGPGRNISGKTEFPSQWSDEKSINSIYDVLKDPNSKWTQQTGSPGAKYTKKGDPVRWSVEGHRDGIDIKVIVAPDGEGIITAFPTNVQPNP